MRTAIFLVFFLVATVLAVAFASNEGLIAEEQLLALGIPLVGLTTGLIVAFLLRALILSLGKRP